MSKAGTFILVQCLISVVVAVGEVVADCKGVGQSCNVPQSTHGDILLQTKQNRIKGVNVPTMDCNPGSRVAFNIDTEGNNHCKDIFTDHLATGCQQNSVDNDNGVIVGCFVKDANDLGGEKTTTVLAGGHFIDTCMNHTDHLCLSGFPFYQWEDVDSGIDCLQNCVEKGLDLAAYFQTKRCRCGASAINRQIWPEDEENIGQHPFIENLFFKPAKLTNCSANTATGCELQVLRYSRQYVHYGIPADLNFDDVTYTDSIVAGMIHPEEDTIDHPGDSLMEVADQVEKGEQSPGWERPCWPSNCGPGRGPWRERQTNPPNGTADVWEEYVTIKYWFEQNVDNGRKTAFRSAVRKWRDNTCINLIEHDTLSLPAIKVGIYDPNSCYLSGMGWPGTSGGYSKINLGWCNSDRNIGSMVHEIGHAIGMNHEQKRPDGAAEYNGKGPNLQMHWQNIPSGWVPQYTGAPSSYTGSTDQGPGDPWIGYAPYDFGSIMHYPGGSRYDTIPPEKESLVGNRVSLTDGDIDQMLDVYQCKIKNSQTTPPVTPPPGSPGIDGPPGVDGPPGNKGVTGPSGPPGRPGPPGLSSPSPVTPPPGPPGIDGPPGNPGVVGPPGSPGNSGPPGSLAPTPAPTAPPGPPPTPAPTPAPTLAPTPAPTPAPPGPPPTVAPTFAPTPAPTAPPGPPGQAGPPGPAGPPARPGPPGPIAPPGPPGLPSPPGPPGPPGPVMPGPPGPPR